MASQESGASSKLPLILAGASVAVSTTIAAVAVWWASGSSSKGKKSEKKTSPSALARDPEAQEYEDVRANS